MRELSAIEAQAVSGAWAKNWGDALLGAVAGSQAGAAAGLMFGGKFGTGGGWIVGGISQLFGWTGSAAFGFVAGGILGALVGGNEAKAIIIDWGGKLLPAYAK
jgi:hypothetical protein